MEITQMLTWIIGFFTGIGALLAGAGYGYGQFKKGVRSADEETIISLQNQIEAIRSEMDLIRTENKELKGDNKELVGQNNKLQGQLETYKEIAMGQDPEMREIMKTLAQTVPVLSQNILYCQKRNEKVTT
jgi:predicted RNase H-like nuclease (RuvC/YqgF family)